MIAAPETLALHKSDSPNCSFRFTQSNGYCPVAFLRGNCLPLLFLSIPWISVSVSLLAGCYTVLHSNSCFKVKSLNPVSSFTTDDVTFATPCNDLCKPCIIAYRSFECGRLFKARGKVIALYLTMQSVIQVVLNVPRLTIITNVQLLTNLKKLFQSPFNRNSLSSSLSIS
jgi:hypothetical protein